VGAEAEVIRYGSLCSGIEAVTVAWHPLGAFEPSFFAEIEAFPSAVLAHHWPAVPNLGDITAPDFLDKAAALGDIDVLVGGSPCQGFSRSGLWGGMNDPRSALLRTFCDVADAADPAIVLWENVPGVLCDETNGFGCLLAALAGADSALEPGPRPEPGRPSAHWRWSEKTRGHIPRWTRAGFVAGPKRRVAWRILDAQYHELPQQRERVFVVAVPASGRLDPAEILFEPEGVRRDSPPRREPQQAPAGDTPVCFGGNNTSGAIDVAPALLAQPGSGWKGDFESETFAVHAFPANLSGTQVAATKDVTPALGAKNPTAVAYQGRVRRLLPQEVEKLQGFPDGHTAIPYKGKPAADGPRYKSIGNSMAVNVMRWLGVRIAKALENNHG
jgi:DNA (cytosine-5)-methyltransferase 1